MSSTHFGVNYVKKRKKEYRGRKNQIIRSQIRPISFKSM
jgi:hypothetical protein